MYGQAIEHYLEAREFVKAERIVDRIMEHYWKEGKLSEPDVVQNLSKFADLPDKLEFLKRYANFHENYAARNFALAARILVDILTGNPAPRVFWPTVLVDAIPLLEAEEVLFNTNDTFELMRCLEEVLTSFRKTDFIKALREQDLELVRLALVRNLARAMM